MAKLHWTIITNEMRDGLCGVGKESKHGMRSVGIKDRVNVA